MTYGDDDDDHDEEESFFPRHLTFYICAYVTPVSSGFTNIHLTFRIDVSK